MRRNCRMPGLGAASLIALVLAASPAAAAPLVSDSDLGRMGLQRFWSIKVPLDPDELITRITRLDDSLYLLTTANRAISLHVHTGVIRWSNFVAPEGQAVRGPTHSADYALFTAAGSVRFFDRSTGESAGEPRTLRGVVVESARDYVTVSIGQDHGVSSGDVLKVFRANDLGEADGDPIAQVKILTLRPRSARGQVQPLEGGDAVRPGDRVTADVTLPIREVKLPFAASSPAVADNENVYAGAANQRLYSIRIRGGTINWQVVAPDTVSATPILSKGNLYFAGQNGQVVSCTAQEKARNWSFQTEGPIFADMVLDAAGLFVASSDRSLYLLDRESGRRLWRERFDTPLDQAPGIAGERLYQSTQDGQLFALETKTGRRLWHRPEGGQFLLELEGDAYLLEANGSSGRLLRVNALNGNRKDLASAGGAGLAASSREDQAVYLVSTNGAVECLRSRHAPRLTPAQVEAALRHQKKIELAARLDAEQKKDAAAKKKAAESMARGSSLFEDDDGLASRSTATPVGGHKVLPLEPAVKVTQPPADEAKEETDKPAEEAAESAEEQPAAEQEAEEPADAEQGAEDAEAATSKPAEEESDEGEDESSKEDEGEKDKDDNGG